MLNGSWPDKVIGLLFNPEDELKSLSKNPEKWFSSLFRNLCIIYEFDTRKYVASFNKKVVEAKAALKKELEKKYWKLVGIGAFFVAFIAGALAFVHFFKKRKAERPLIPARGFPIETLEPEAEKQLAEIWLSLIL